MKKLMMLVALLLLGSTWSIKEVLADKDTDAVVEYDSGNLVLDPNAVLPDDLDFGTHEIQTLNPETLVAMVEDPEEEDEFIPVTSAVEVSDNRGDESGWVVKLAQVEQFETASEAVLEDAQLQITYGTLANNLNLLPSISVAGGMTPVSIGTASDLIVAAEGQGIGETVLPINQFALHILADTAKVPELYTAELNWTIEVGE